MERTGSQGRGRRAGILALVAMVALAACARPLPEDKLDYVGVWKSRAVTLVISPGGRIAYQRKTARANTNISAPIQRFNDDGFTVGVVFFNTDFKVSVPPHRTDHHWMMMVDGEVLVRVACVRDAGAGKLEQVPLADPTDRCIEEEAPQGVQI